MGIKRAMKTMEHSLDGAYVNFLSLRRVLEEFVKPDEDERKIESNVTECDIFKDPPRFGFDQKVWHRTGSWCGEIKNYLFIDNPPGMQKPAWHYSVREANGYWHHTVPEWSLRVEKPQKEQDKDAYCYDGEKHGKWVGLEALEGDWEEQWCPRCGTRRNRHLAEGLDRLSCVWSDWNYILPECYRGERQ